MKRDEAVQILGYLGAFFPSWRLDERAIELWATELADLDFAKAKPIVREMARASTAWPTLAEIRRRYAGALGLTAPSSSDAWAEVATAISTAGRRNSVHWSHPAIANTVAALGWGSICGSGNLDTIRAQFRRAYEEQARVVDLGAVTALDVPALASRPPTEPVAEIESRGEFPEHLRRANRELPPVPPEPERTPTRWAAEIGPEHPFVTGLRDAGWSEREIADEVERSGGTLVL